MAPTGGSTQISIYGISAGVLCNALVVCEWCLIRECLERMKGRIIYMRVDVGCNAKKISGVSKKERKLI